MRRANRTRGPRRRNKIEHLAVGHDAIDADHKAIVECCNEIADSTAAAVEFQLHRLRALLASHFQNEEFLLKATGSTLCACHAREHEFILALSEQAIEAHRKGFRVSRRMVLRDIIPALREHIAYRDQLLALHLNSLDEGAPRFCCPHTH